MISGWGYQTLDPLCALASGNCGAILADSPLRFPAARGPPLGEAQQVSAGRCGLQADFNSCQT
jgi:hypothetical protein